MRHAKRIGAWALTLLGVVLLWGLVEPYSIDEKREVALLPDLPRAWEGRQIAVIADFQYGMWGANTGTVQRVVRRLVEKRPAAVLIAGDFVYKADDRLDVLSARVAREVAPLAKAGIPTFAVLGNHDYSMDVRDDPVNHTVARGVEAALERAGVVVLHNEAAALRLNGMDGTATSLYVVGIDDEWPGLARPAEAVARVPTGAARIVMMHNPRSFRGLPAGTAPLAVAAHTHGGQIALPFTPHWSWMSLVKDEQIEADGWAQDREEPRGNRLYVNIGIGFSDLPLRINARPEMTLFTLRRGT